MVIIGLTGSVAMGKSFVASLFSRFHIPVFDADKAVHKLLGKKGDAVEKIAVLCSEAFEDGTINRKILAKWVFGDASALKKIEAILHPLVQKQERSFIKRMRMKGYPMVVLEIPLLFETQADRRCDVVITVSAPSFLQERRVMERPGMTPEKLYAMRKRQSRDHYKRRQADYLVYTGAGKAVTYRQIKTIIQKEICHA